MSFRFPKVVESLLLSRFSSENITSILRIDSADPSLRWKQDGGGGTLKFESSEKLHS